MRGGWGGGRDGSETGLLTKKKGEKIGNQYRCQPHPGLQRQRGQQQITTPPPPILTYLLTTTNNNNILTAKLGKLFVHLIKRLIYFQASIQRNCDWKMDWKIRRNFVKLQHCVLPALQKPRLQWVIPLGVMAAIIFTLWTLFRSQEPQTSAVGCKSKIAQVVVKQ